MAVKEGRFWGGGDGRGERGGSVKICKGDEERGQREDVIG